MLFEHPNKFKNIFAKYLPLFHYHDFYCFSFGTKSYLEKTLGFDSSDAVQAYTNGESYMSQTTKNDEMKQDSLKYLDYILAVKVVDSVDEAIEHISKYSTGHSESIVSENYTNTQKFLNEVDSAAVYVNASTRFTDGNEFGFGAEIGISTQKLHARGPMGLREITTSKYIIYGNGQIRG